MLTLGAIDATQYVYVSEIWPNHLRSQGTALGLAVFYLASELTEIGKGPISYLQVGERRFGRSLQILSETYAPGADTGRVPLVHDGEEGAVVIGKIHESKESNYGYNAGTGVYEDLLAGVTLARSGAGLFQAYRFTLEEELRSNTLVEVLSAQGGCSRPFSVLYPHGRHLSLNVRSFVDFLTAAVNPGS